MRASQALLRTTIIASVLSTSLLNPKTLQPTTATAELTAPPHTPGQIPSSNPQTIAWQTTTWEHWDSTGLDPQHAPYPVVFIGNTLQDIPENKIANAIQTSIDTWNNVSCAVQQLHFAGFRPTIDDVSEHEIPIFIPNADFWKTQKNLIASTNMNNPAIALNTAHFTWSLEPAPFQYLSPNTSSDPLIVDLQSVLTHELGHILGLWHTLDDATATMSAKYLPDATQRTLAADDKFALCHLYPNPGNNPECTRNHECPHGSCVTDDTFQVCQKHQANAGEYCALDLLHCAHGCIIDSPATGTGYCTTACQTHADCPTHFDCKLSDNRNLCLLTRPTPPDPNERKTSCSTITRNATPYPNPIALLACLAFARLTRIRHRR